MHDEVTLHMRAPAREIWELVSDVRNTGRFSPETVDAQWLGGATGPAVGVRFRGKVVRNGRGPTYWSECRITACEPGSEFGFVVLLGGRPINHWHYRFVPAGDGTDVTESFRLEPSTGTRVYWALLGRARGRTNREGMRKTLERIRAVVEDPAV
ncbi:SRPBCC family protein [Pseudonocardia sp. ICBG1293]|uniref:SRPBCC family protein n=1 Tax=Pseudonocardia sp. ICBG1293 TaxID=2844382 RepID=UPI001CCD7B1D|nr:SRPBCC family protein [Pseudonocardia sp. ICBG1293]